MMRALTLAELEAPLSAQLIGVDCEVLGVSTDSRSVEKGDLFVALQGENFDGHDYLAQVENSGAIAALVSSGQSSALPQLQVEDTQRALGLLGSVNRQLYTGPLVAITGSSGKTTVKNMVQAVLSTRGKTLATDGNFNNEIGVPLTLLRLQSSHEFAVVEMGASKIGDIAWLCELGRPSVALLLNALPAHLEGFGSLDNVAQAKGEIFDQLGAGDTAVFNADLPWASKWRKRAGDATVLDFGLEQPAAISARDISLRGIEGVSFTATTGQGDIAIRLSLPGIHNVANALAAVAAGLACELSLIEIRDGLESLQPVAGRLHTLNASSGAVVIDDCYNANPGSVRAAIDTLASCDGTRTMILGAMGELGERSGALHRETGEYARAAGIEQLWGVGPPLREAVEVFGDGGRHFESRELALAAVQIGFGSGDFVLVKGSRSSRMEEVLGGFPLEASMEGAPQ